MMQKLEILSFAVVSAAASAASAAAGAPDWFVMGLPILGGGGLSAYFRLKNAKAKGDMGAAIPVVIASMPISIMTGWWLGLGLAAMARDPTPHDAVWAFFLAALVGAQAVEALWDVVTNNAKDAIIAAAKAVYNRLARKGDQP